MALNDFIISSLNLKTDDIQSINSHKSDDTLYIQITLRDSHPSCIFCGSDTKIHGYLTHTYKHLPICGTPSAIEWKRIRYKCKCCGSTFSQPSPFGLGRYHVTYALLANLAKDLKNHHKTFQDIAADNGISNTLVQLYFDSLLNIPRLTLPENLGIDEIHSSLAKYNSKYLCVMVDNQRRVLQEILPSRSKHHLSNYFEAIPLEERKRVKFVTIDMWLPYKQVCERFLPNCEIAVDPFHVIEHLSNDFSRLRIDIMNQCVYGSAAYYLLKKWHWLLEQDVFLDNKPEYNSFFKKKMNRRELYDLLLGLNSNLKLAYQLKEKYRRFNREASFENAPAWFDSVLQEFKDAHLPCYDEFITLLTDWKQEILNSFRRPVDDRKQSNSLSENFNGKLRELIDISHGYYNFDRFRARALYCFNDFVFYSLFSKLDPKKKKGRKRGPYKKDSPVLLTDTSFKDILSNAEDDFSED